MSFKLGVKGIQEILVIVLMLVFIFVLYSQIELTYKIGIAAGYTAILFMGALVPNLGNFIPKDL